MRRETGQNLAAALVLQYAVDARGPPPLHKLALPLWVALGLGQFQGLSDKNGGHLALIWEDADGKTWLAYNTPQYVVRRHGLASTLSTNLAAVVPILERAAN